MGHGAQSRVFAAGEQFHRKPPSALCGSPDVGICGVSPCTSLLRWSQAKGFHSRQDLFKSTQKKLHSRLALFGLTTNEPRSRLTLFYLTKNEPRSRLAQGVWTGRLALEASSHIRLTSSPVCGSNHGDCCRVAARCSPEGGKITRISAFRIEPAAETTWGREGEINPEASQSKVQRAEAKGFEEESTAARGEGSQFAVRCAESESELYASAWLRSHCFCKFPRHCSSDIQQRQRRIRAEEETEILLQKVQGLLPGFPRTACLLASTPAPADIILAAEDLPLLLSEQPQQSNVLSSWGTEVSMSSALAVGTLDLNVGLRLPGEDLVGDWPKAEGGSGDVLQGQRGYISNVCVATSWRSQGLAGHLLRCAQLLAKSWGVVHLYIHVEVDNAAARRVYEREGYVLDKQETVAAARYFCRKPRLLLHKSLAEHVAENAIRS